jgi:hypothetical protein
MIFFVQDWPSATIGIPYPAVLATERGTKSLQNFENRGPPNTLPGQVYQIPQIFH